MLQYLQEVIPYAITNTIFQSIVFGLLIWLVVKAISQSPTVSSHARYALNLSGSFVSLAIFLALFWQQLSRIPEVPYPPAAVSTAYLAKVGGTTTLQELLITITIILAPYIAALYLGALLVKCYQLIGNYYGQQKILKRKERKAPVDIRLLVQHYSTVLGIGKPIKVIANYAAAIPFTTGFLKPIIYLPLATINQLTKEEVEAIILHELVHIRRYDYLLNLIMEISGILLFFNPFTRMMVKDAKIWREISCDDTVLQFKVAPKNYAHALLQCGVPNEYALRLAANGHSSFHLLNRIKRIMAEKPPHSKANNRFVLVPAVFSFMIVISIALGFNFSIDYENDKKNISKNSKAIDNVRMNSLSTWLGNKLPLSVKPVARQMAFFENKLSSSIYYFNSNWDVYPKRDLTTTDYTRNTTNNLIRLSDFEASTATSNSQTFEAEKNDIQSPELAVTETSSGKNSASNYAIYETLASISPKKPQPTASKNYTVAKGQNATIINRESIPIITNGVEWAEDIRIVLSENQKQSLINNQEAYLKLALTAFDKEVKQIEEQISSYSFDEIEAIEKRLADQLKKIEDKASRMLRFRNKILVENKVSQEAEAAIECETIRKAKQDAEQINEQNEEQYQFRYEIINPESIKDNKANSRSKIAKGKLIIAVTL